MGILDWVSGKGIADWLGGKQGYDEARKQTERAWNEAKGYGERGFGFQEPYRQAGLDQIGTLNNVENNLLNPSDLLAKWMESYQTSPYAQRSMENARASGLDAASSMGLMGSSAALNNLQQSSADIMQQDRQAYLNDLMNKYMQGAGIGQNMFGVGANTAGNMGNQAFNLGNQRLGVGQDLAGAAYGSANAGSSFLSDMLAQGLKAYLGGGGAGAMGGAK
jgi:hypothetical protein